MREIHNDADFADFLVALEVGVLHVWSTWWPSRDQSETLLRELVVHMEPDVSVASFNADECVELCEKLNVRSVPAILVFEQALEVRRFLGARVSAQIIRLAVANVLLSAFADASGRPRGPRRNRGNNRDRLFHDSASLFREPPGERLAGFFVCDLPQLNLDQARWLAEQRQDVLLTQLASLPPPIAHALAAHRGVLSFPKVRKLDAEAAYVLGQFRGQALVLDGLRSLSAEIAGPLSDVAEPLTDASGILSLSGVRRISTLAAQALSLHFGELILDGLVELPPKVASHLAQHRGSVLSLGGLSAIYEETARCLAQYPGTLRMTGLRAVSNCAADELFATRGQLELYDHRELSAYARERLRLFL